MEGLALLPAHTAHAHRSAHGVHVRILMAHDEHPAALTDELHEGVGGDTGADLAPVLCLPGSAAEEGEVQPVLHHRLVAAPAQGHFDGQGGKFIALLKGGTVHTQADGQGGGKTCRVGNLVDGLQHGEFLLHGLPQVPLFKDKQKPVLFQPTEKPVIPLRPLGDGVVNPGGEAGDGAFRQVLGQLVIVVHQDDGNHRAGADVLVPHLVKLREIREIQHPQPGLLRVVACGDHAVNPVPPLLQGHVVGVLRLAGQEPVGIEAGEDVPDGLLLEGVPVAGDLVEGLVAVDNLLIRQANHRHGEGTVGAKALVLLLQQLLEVVLHLVLPLHPHQQVHPQLHAGYGNAHPCQNILVQKCRRHGKYRQHADVEQTSCRPQQPSKFLIHLWASPPKWA